MEIIHPEEVTPIPEYYRGRNLFFTGATGFLGKALIEKLLRCCPEIGNIYILIRQKKNQDIEERTQALLSSKLFDTLRETAPQQLSKVIPVQGECSQLKLGLNDSDYKTITSTVSIIYHVAASVRFDDPLKSAILLNTRGTRELAQMALQTPGLSLLVHVSTAFCNCVMGDDIKEELYPPPCDWRKAIQTAEQLDNEVLNLLTDKYLGPYPNTYTFTKALGEQVIKDLCEGNIPTLIVRPSIVVSSVSDPVPGWVDNFNGPVGLLVACGKGLLRCSYQNPNIISDYIPVDVTVKATIVASWYFGLKQQRDKIEVMHVTSSDEHWLNVHTIVRVGLEITHKEVTFNNCVWVAKGSPSNSRLYAYICTIFFHLLPAFFLDLGLKLAGRKAILCRIQMKIYNASLQLRYFTLQTWFFHNDKYKFLKGKILPQEREVWRYELPTDIHNYLKKSILGARRYLLNEPDDTLEQARIHYNRMYWLDKIAMTLLYGSIFWVVIHYGFIARIGNYIYNSGMYYVEDI